MEPSELQEIFEAFDRDNNGKIDYDEFGARQRASWDAIRAAGPEVEERVLRALRDSLPSPRTVRGEGRA